MHISYDRLFPEKPGSVSISFQIEAGTADALQPGTYHILDLYPIQPEAKAELFLNISHSDSRRHIATLCMPLRTSSFDLWLSPQHLQSPEAPQVLRRVEEALKPAKVLKLFNKRFREVQALCKDVYQTCTSEEAHDLARFRFLAELLGVDLPGPGDDLLEFIEATLANPQGLLSLPQPKVVPIAKGRKGRKKQVKDFPQPVNSLIVHVDLKGAKPPIWRRIQLPASLTLLQLHKVLQVAMGWTDSHLWHFTDSQGDEYVPGEAEGYEPSWHSDDLAPSDYTVGEFLARPGDWLDYTYDFGDDWEHRIVLEECRNELAAPRVLKAVNACPPEDCGGIWGYADILRVLGKKRKSAVDRELLEWLGEDFDPACFDSQEANLLLQGLRF